MSDIYLQITETPTVVTLSAPVVSGALASTVTVANTVTVALDSNSLSALENVTVTVGAAITGTVTVSNFPATQPVSIASVTIGNTVTIAGTVTANPTGTQTIAGTVTANVQDLTNCVEAFDEGPAQSVVAVHLKDLSGAVLGTSGTPLPISGTVTIGSALPAGTNRIGVVTIGAGTVTIGAGTAQIGSVTASLQFTTTAGQIGQDGLTKILQQDLCPGLYQNDIQPYGVPIAFIDPSSQGQPTFRVVGNNGYSLPVIITTGNSRIGVVTIGAGTVTIGAGTAQIGSVTASISGTVPISISSVTVGNSLTIGSLPAISGTVTANTFALQGTAVTTSNFTSTTASTVLASFNATREVLTIFNEGAGNLHICAGATCTTIAYQVRLSAGDYYEVPNHQTTITHSAVFATAGTARVCQVS